MLPFIQIFGKTVGTYALSAIVGLLLCGFVACRLGKSRGITVEDVILVMVSLAIGMVVGGHIVYGLTNLPTLIQTLGSIGQMPASETLQQIVNCFGGMVFYGGFFGGLAAVILHTHFAKGLDRALVLDLFAVTTPLFHTFGRIGCFFGGCCYGVESSWGFLVEDNPLVPELCGVVRLPIQLFEACGNFLLFVLLCALFCKSCHKGRLLFLYMPLYAVMRFCMEFFRGDVIRGVWWGLSTSQWISLLLLLFTAVRLAVLAFRRPAQKRA